MKKRIPALLLSAALCVSMTAPAYAVSLKIDDTNKLTFEGTSAADPGEYYAHMYERDPDTAKSEFIGTVKVTVDSDGNVSSDFIKVGTTDDRIQVTAGKQYGISYSASDDDGAGDGLWTKDDGGDEKPDPGDNKPGTGSGNKKPVIDDGKDDDDSSSTVITSGGSGGASGASSKYIKNEPRGNQTVTPVTTPSTEWTSSTNIPQFTDVASTDWFYNAVQFVGQHGMMAGSNGRFSPYDKLTRGMMAQILYNMEGAPGGTAATFPDVSSSDWFANAATWAASCGYMSGYANGYFGPLDPITREQLASILYRYASAKGYDVTAASELNFTDGATTSSWAVPAMKWAVGTGLLSGKTGVSGTRLDPLGNATRAEVAQILMNFSQKIAR